LGGHDLYVKRFSIPPKAKPITTASSRVVATAIQPAVSGDTMRSDAAVGAGVGQICSGVAVGGRRGIWIALPIGRGVTVDTSVGDGRVRAAVGPAVGSGVETAVLVGREVGVGVSERRVLVGAAVTVGAIVGDSTGTDVAVLVGSDTGVSVGVGISVLVGVGTGVLVGDGRGVSVGAGVGVSTGDD
jgi:hypothetical protein